jgi:hypothetical protein
MHGITHIKKKRLDVFEDLFLRKLPDSEVAELSSQRDGEGNFVFVMKM